MDINESSIEHYAEYTIAFRLPFLLSTPSRLDKPSTYVLHPMPFLLLALQWFAAPVAIDLDLAAGPCAQLVQGPFRDTRTWLPGIALDAAAVVPGDIARAKAPRSARKFIDRRGEVRLRPWWLAILPQEITTAPGDSLSAFGARWALFGIDGGLALGHVRLRAGVDLLSASWLHLSGPAFVEERNAWVLGSAAKGTLLFLPTRRLNLEMGWVQQVGFPTTAWEGQDRRSLPWTSGTARALLHLRIPVQVGL